MDGLESLKQATTPKPVVAIVGGAVAGSEAAAACAARGVIAVVFEQGERPYGKIEDGLPRWHEKLREKEYRRIDDNLQREGVVFVPETEVGRDIAWDEIYRDLGFSAIVLANGAWRDRPLAIEGAHAYVSRGLVYQNELVYWFNHYDEPGYDGPVFDIPDDVIVVGGGLASIDVVKIVNLELYARAFRARGIEVDLVEMEVKGIPKTLEAYGLTMDELGVKGCKLYYRRRMEDMPLASADSPTPDQLAKLQAARIKIMERVMRKYLVDFEPLCMPIAIIVEDGRLVGIRFQKTEVVEGRVRGIEGTERDVHATMVISSIGSIPRPIAGIPLRGELYYFDSWDSGQVHGLPGVFGLGNVLTGKGNIKDSRANAIEIIENAVASYLGVGEEPARTPGNESLKAREVAERVEGHGRPMPPEAMKALAHRIEARHREVGYQGYRSWIAAHRPR